MKILLISSEFPPGPGGIGTHAFELARGLHNLGHQIDVIAPQDYVTPGAAAQFRAGLDFRLIPPPVRTGLLRRPANTLTMIRHLRQADPDVVIVSGGGAVRAAALLARGCPWIAIAHGTEIRAGGWLSRSFTRWGFGRATTVVSVSEYTAGQLASAGVLPRRSKVIYNGANLELTELGRQAPALSDRLPESAAGGPLILTVGNVTERKGQEVIVRAMPAIAAKVPNAHYVLVGLPTEGQPLRKLADQLGVGDRVHFVGTISTEELAGAYRDATVLAMTSRHTAEGDFEGFGIAAVEAALLGTPAVVSNSGGLPEAVVDEVTGLVVPENDVAATGAAIVALLNDPERTERLGRAASERAHRELGWPAVVERYDQLIRSVGPYEPASDRSPRKLIFISDTPHYLLGHEPVGWAATIREIDVLSQLFEEIIHITPLYKGMDDFAMAPYRARNVTMRFIHQAGGDELSEKLSVLLAVRGWSKAIGEELAENPDALVHVRGPSSVALFAVLRAAIFRTPIHWFKYAGNWMPVKEQDYDPWSYGLQRMLLRHIHRGPVTVNGRWPDQPESVRTFINPTYTRAELEDAQRMAAGKTLDGQVRLLFVGRLYPTKGAMRALEITRRLVESGYDIHLDVVGDGPQRDEMTAQIAAVAELTDNVQLHGWVQREQLGPLYATAHFLVLPTEWEGFPKVLSEAMSFGAIPLAGAVSSIPQTLADLGVGYALPSAEIDRWVAAIKGYIDDPAHWLAEAELCMRSAEDFSFDTYLRNVIRLFRDFWSIDLEPAPNPQGSAAGSST